MIFEQYIPLRNITYFLRKFMKALATAATLVTLLMNASPSVGQDFNDPHYFGGKCFSELARVNGTYEYGHCVPTPINLSYKSQNQFDKYMSIAVDAAAENGDYDTAIINFRRALQIRPNSTDAQRGLKAASAAKEQAKIWEYNSSEENSSYLIWVKISGIRSSFD